MQNRGDWGECRGNREILSREMRGKWHAQQVENANQGFLSSCNETFLTYSLFVSE